VQSASCRTIGDCRDEPKLRPQPADGEALRPLSLSELLEGSGLGRLDEVGDELSDASRGSVGIWRLCRWDAVDLG
jgi:hypothetical protein